MPDHLNPTTTGEGHGVIVHERALADIGDAARVNCRAPATLQGLSWEPEDVQLSDIERRFPDVGWE